VKRPKALGEFILDYLLKVAKEEQEKFWKRHDTRIRDLMSKHSGRLDGDIREFIGRFDTSDMWKSEVAAVKAFVLGYHKQWLDLWSGSPSKRAAAAFTSKAKLREGWRVSTAKLRELAKEFNRGPSEEETRELRKFKLLDKVMASYAYTVRPKFAFHVAFTAVLTIKAEAVGASPMTEKFAGCSVISKTALRIMDSQRASGARRSLG
jgi:RNA-dependent RNA polymerase